MTMGLLLATLLHKHGASILGVCKRGVGENAKKKPRGFDTSNLRGFIGGLLGVGSLEVLGA